MYASDLEAVQLWLREPHVARWWLAGSTLDGEFNRIRVRVHDEADTATRMLIVTEGERPIGWAQWYGWDDYPDDAADLGAQPGDIGFDYAIGDPASIGRSLGTEMVVRLVQLVRRHHALAGIVVAPDAGNLPSRRVLQRSGFQTVDVRRVASDPSGGQVAIYRLAPTSIRLATAADVKDNGPPLDQFN
jgi:RimJ/RimL family protein N-acetyltransferase